MRLVLRGSVVSLVGVVVGARVAAMLPRVRFRLPCPRAGWLQLASVGSTGTQQAPGTGWSFSSWPWLQLQDALGSCCPFVLAFSVKRICSFAPARTHDNGVRQFNQHEEKRKARAVQLSETRWMSAHTLEIERQQKRAIIKRRLGGQATRSMLWFSGEWSRALLSLPFEIWRCGNDARRHQQRRGRQGSRSVRAGAAGVAGATTAPLSPIRPPQAPSGSDHGLSEAYQQPGTRGAPHTAAAI